MRLIQGAQEEQHSISVHAHKWLFEPGTPGQPTPNNSGHTNAQSIGISEHFEFDFADKVMPVFGNKGIADFLYQSAPADNLWDGLWGVFRTYAKVQNNVAQLPNNPYKTTMQKNPLGAGTCPTGTGAPPKKTFNVQAWLAKDLVGADGITYNQRFGYKDPAGIVFINGLDYAAITSGQKKLEPLVMRVNSGDCMEVTLENHLPTVLPEYDSWNIMPPIVPGFNFNQVKTSNRVSLHPQLLSYDVNNADGAAIGENPDTTVGPGQSIRYAWYAGKIAGNSASNVVLTPIEFGTTNLRDFGDVFKHSSHGAIGSLIVEPVGAQYKDVGGSTLINSGNQADVYNSAGQFLFREFVVQYQDDLTMKNASGAALTSLAEPEDSEDSGMKGFNYKTEPLWARLGFGPEVDLETLNSQDYSNVLSSIEMNPGCGGPCGDPETPVFTASVGMNVRFRVSQSNGHPRQHGFALFGHNWQYEPWTNGSTVIGNNPLTFLIGSRSGHSVLSHGNLVVTAGGNFRVPGDYLYRTQEGFHFSNGLWGIFRVTQP
jgi:hypothetical protein